MRDLRCCVHAVRMRFGEQRWHVSDEGGRFVKLYKLKTFPCICVIDPRTSENLGTFASVLTPQDFFSFSAWLLAVAVVWAWRCRH